MIGKYDLKEFIAYLKENPDFTGALLTLMFQGRTKEVESVREYIRNLDLNTPFSKIPIHKGYPEHKHQILKVIQDPEAFSLENLTLKTNYQDQRDMQSRYSRYAEQYDQLMTSPNLFLDMPIAREEAMQWMDIKPHEEILECGVGTGLTFNYYPDYANVTAIDINEDMLRIAREKLKKIKKNVTILSMDVEKMTFSDNKFDKVLCYFFLCTTRDPLKCLQEVHRVCRKDGKIIVLDIVHSDIDEFRLVQYLMRPIVRALGHVYIPDCPVYAIPYDCCLDTHFLLDKVGIKVEKTLPLTPSRDIALMECSNS